MQTLSPAEWCPEQGIASPGQPVLIWHALDASGTAMPLDRATVMTYEDPPVLQSAADPETNQILSEINKGGGAPPLYVVSMMRGDTLTIYGFYDGRPDAAALAQIFAGIKDGKARVFATYNAKTRNITIVTPPKE